MCNRRINYIIATKKYRVREYKNNKERTVGYFDKLIDAKICQAGHHWISGKVPDPVDNFGFVYLITDHLTDMMYIGKKQFFFWGGKGSAPSANDKQSDKWVAESWVDSDWKFYTSSSKILAPIIAERYDDFTFEVLENCSSKLELHLREIYWQQKFNVLEATLPNGDREFYNQNIGSCEFNIHDSGEVARSIRYHPLHQAWSKAMQEFYFMDQWADPKVFIKDNEYSAKGMIKPVIVPIDPTQPIGTYNIRILNDPEIIDSTTFQGIAKVGNLYEGHIAKGGVVVHKVKGVSERMVAAELDDLIDKHNLPMEKQLKWV